MNVLFLFLLSIPFILCSVIDEEKEWQRWKKNQLNYFLITEKADMVVDELFAQYPSLKPSTEKGVFEVKTLLSALLEMDKGLRKTFEKAGSIAKEKELVRLLNRLSELLEEEFEDLEEEEQDYLENVENFMWHKLNVQLALKVIKKKKEHYRKLKLTEEQQVLDVMKRGKTLQALWNPNMDEQVKEWKRKLQEIDEMNVTDEVLEEFMKARRSDEL